MHPTEKENRLNISRRKFLKSASVLAAVPLLNGLNKEALAQPSQKNSNKPGAGNYRTRLILLGTSGGVSWWPGTNRTSSSSALVVGEAIYLIDLGQNSTYRLSEAFNSGSFVNSKTIEDPDGFTFPGGKVEDGSPTFLNKIKSLFFTHLHPDHISDYPAFLLIGSGASLGNPQRDPVTKEMLYTPLQVLGPCSRGELEEDKSNYLGPPTNGTIVQTDLADLNSIAYPGLVTPTPGTRQMTKIIWQAFAQSINDMTLDNGYPDFTKLVTIKEIGGTDSGDIPWPAGFFPDPNKNTCPAIDKFLIYPEDENGVSVWATFVDHHQVFPAFAFRFDTPDGSVVFSGDTGHNTTGLSNPTNQQLANGNLQRLADGADVLVHEVIDRAWIDQKFGPAPTGNLAALKTHMLGSHTTIDEVGTVAANCNVKVLVLNHIVPGNTPISHLLQAKQNFPGKLIIGEDLMQIGVGKDRRKMPKNGA
jgi:ribonuclease BN (tRNA processing enzyme)